MNLIEAIKSEKPFRRATYRGPYARWIADRHMFLDSGGWELKLKKDDIIAEDWEIEEKKVTITKRDLDAALGRLNRVLYGYQAIDSLAKELGLE